MPEEVQLIAVSKKQSIDKIRHLYDLGQRDFGENYVQELAEKVAKLKDSCSKIRWHFLGHLQKNKIQQLLPLVTTLHSLDSAELAERLECHCAKIDKKIEVYIQINIDGEGSKSGFKMKEAENFVKKLNDYPHLVFLGWMIIPDPNRQEIKKSFKDLQLFSLRLKGYTLGKLSMGMSSDYRDAIEFGSSCVRLGSVLFGSRN